MMADDAVLAELRTIRDLLILTGGEEVDVLTEDLDDKHFKLLEEINTGEWAESGDVTPVVAEALDISKRSVNSGKDDLLELGYIEQSGEARGTKYRKTGIGLAGERTNQL